MKFYQNKEPYEALRIGKKSKAIEVGTIHIIVVSKWTEPNLDGIDVEKRGQTVVSLSLESKKYLLSSMQKGNMSKELILGALAFSQSPANPTYVGVPIFYKDSKISWPASNAHRVPMYSNGTPFFTKDIVDKWILDRGNGDFYKIPKDILQKIPDKEHPGWDLVDK